jgi:hypothetical protein
MGIVVVRAFTGSVAGVLPGVAITATRRRYQVIGHFRQTLGHAFGQTIFDRNVAAFDIACVG